MAARGFSSTINAMLSAGQSDLAILVYLNWPGGVVRAWSGIGPITWSGNTYTGVGTLGAIDKVADSVNKADIGVELSFNYLDDTLRNNILGTDPIGRDASIYVAAITPATATVADAYELFPGFMDEVRVEDGGNTGRIVVRIASELARLNRPMAYQLTDAHQQALFSGDLGMQFAPRMNETITWGRKPTVVYPTAPPPPNYYDPNGPWWTDPNWRP